MYLLNVSNLLTWWYFSLFSCHTKDHRLGGFNNRKLFLTVLANSVSGETSVLQIAPFSVSLTVRESTLVSLSLLLRSQDVLEETATHFSILAWEIPWTEEPVRLQSMGSQRVGHDLMTKLLLLYSVCKIDFYQYSY